MKKLNNKKGFTIVELVIVIAVIGILAGVLIPTFSSVIDSANESSALQQSKSALDNLLAVNNGSIDEKTKFYICNIETENNSKKATIKYAYTYENSALKLDEEKSPSSIDNAKVIYIGSKNITSDGTKVTALKDEAKVLIKAALNSGDKAIDVNSEDTTGKTIIIGAENDKKIIDIRFTSDIGDNMIVVIPKA